MSYITILTIAFSLLNCIVLNEGSSKKGLAVTPRNFLCGDLDAFDNVAWWYDWGANLDIIKAESGCSNVDDYVYDHVPMTWGYGSYFSNYYLNPEADTLLGFNEPNHRQQSNLTAIEAAAHWMEVEDLADGRILVTPSPAPCHGDGCICDTVKWFDDFFAHCQGCNFDYLATHAYSCNPYEIMDFLEGLYDKFKLKIWLTEFACPYETDDYYQEGFMLDLLPSLEEADYIYRYAWYASRITSETSTYFLDKSASLLQPYSSDLTYLGWTYNDFTWYK